MSERKSLRHLLPKIVERDGGEWKCHYCGCPLVPSRIPMGHPTYYHKAGYYEDGDVCYSLNKGYAYPEVDHVQPRSRGGSDNLENLVVSCSSCNAHKHAKPLEKFLQEVNRER